MTRERVAGILGLVVVVFWASWLVVRLVRYTPLPREEGGVLLLDRWRHEVCVVSGEAARCFPIRP